MMFRRSFRKAGAEHRGRGQALVEFSLILVPLMLIFMGILQFGLLFSAQLGLINSTREGARYGATLQTDGSGAASAATIVYCYTVGYASSGTSHCAINALNQAGTLGRSMAGFTLSQLCRSTTDPNCGSDSSSVNYCYYQDPNGTTYSLRLNVRMVYRHLLIVPLIANIVDMIDGASDNSLRASTEEHFRVEGPGLDLSTAQGGAVSACTN
jgi:Flp pilus assembly protein TadG